MRAAGVCSWQQYFGEPYLRAGGFPGQEQSALEADAIEYLLALQPGALVLDLGCGAGRHALELARRGYRVVGVDYSHTFVRLAAAAAEQERLSACFVRADLRALPFTGYFDAAYCVLGTFGLCDRIPEQAEERLAQPQALLAGAALALKPGGRLLVDGAHGPGLAGLPPQEVVQRRGDLIVRERWSFDLASRTIQSVKEFTSMPLALPSPERYVTYLATFEADEVHAVLQANGFEHVCLLGGYDDRRALDRQCGWFVATAQRRDEPRSNLTKGGQHVPELHTQYGTSPRRAV
jgi:SAM-dependent methyltransferase